VEAYKDGTWVELSVGWSDVAKDDVTGDLDVLNVTRPSIGVGLTVCVLESTIGLVAVRNDQSIGTMVRLDGEGLGSTDEG
jgi:hypothetical protein